MDITNQNIVTKRDANYKKSIKKFRKNLLAMDYEKKNETSLKEFLELSEGASEYETLKKNKIPLTDEERKEVFKRDAVWNYASSKDPNTGKLVRKVSAVWKSKDKDGKIWFITNTHRAWQKRPTLKGAINIYHSFIKGTA